MNELWQLLFLKGLAVIYGMAFFSLSREILSLNGSNGIYPTSMLLEAIKKETSSFRYLYYPTLFWLNSSDTALKWTTYLGQIISLFILFGFYPVPLFFLLWILFLSLKNGTSISMIFQFDVLLLEVGLFAPLLAFYTPPSPLGVYLGWFILFRLMFSSGIYKIVIGQLEWRNLTALYYLFETFSFPTPLAYYLHQLPRLIKRFLTAFTLAVELIVPFLIFGSYEARLIAAVLMILFHLGIFLTADLAYFNLLSALLCLLLFIEVEPTMLLESLEKEALWYVVSVIFLFVIQIIAFFDLLFEKRLLFFLKYYNIAGSYAMFSEFSKERFEIIVEGSQDNQNWKVYEFYIKVQNPKIRPLWPQLWYFSRFDMLLELESALKYTSWGWFSHFITKLFQGAPEVLKKIKCNPFIDKPPRFIRCKTAFYRFSDFRTLKDTGNWWVTEPSEDYCSVFYLVDEPHHSHKRLRKEDPRPFHPFSTIQYPFDPYPF